jgi:glycosyltransferase involved in cell wall biosynthesis
MKLSSVSLVAPIYNDVHSMPTVLPELSSLLSRHCKKWEILLIDDGSSDGSVSWIKRYANKNSHMRVLYHSKNRGIARTYRELYQKATYDSVVLFSLDGAWDPADAILLASTLSYGSYDAVVGVRRQKQYAFWRWMVSTLYNALTVGLFGVRTRDAGSIKAIRKKVVYRIPIISKGVFDEAERIIRAHRLGYRIGFVDIHHRPARKKLRGIRLFHVYQAIGDMIKVFLDVRMGSVL